MNISQNIHRAIVCAKMGLFWPGTSRFAAPSSFRMNGKEWSLDLPIEKSLNWVFRDVILDDEYGLKSLTYKPRTIIDIGANVGIFSLWAGINFPDAVIHAYEPNQSLLDYLGRNLKQVGAKIFSEGVSEGDGRGDFTQNGESMIGQCTSSESGEVPVVSLNTAIKRIGGAVDLLKIDCEGEEWSILNDPAGFDQVKMVRMEYHLIRTEQTLERLLETFGNMGFECKNLQQNQGFGLAWFENQQRSKDYKLEAQFQKFSL